MVKIEDSLLYQIFAIVEEIPAGRVATYSQIAELAGLPKNARLIGKALRLSSFYGNYPCHRVVNSEGRLVPNWKEQRDLLEEEKIGFKKNGNVDLNKYKWKVKI